MADPEWYHWNLRKEHISKIKNLKAICINTTAFDWIDWQYCKDNEIIVMATAPYSFYTKEKCKIGIFSNLTLLAQERIDAQVNLEKFDYVWLSFEMEERKPNQGIYEMVQNECGIKPENILFIEDTEQNIEIAKKMGWNTCKAYGYEIDKIKESIEMFLQN